MTEHRIYVEIIAKVRIKVVATPLPQADDSSGSGRLARPQSTQGRAFKRSEGPCSNDPIQLYCRVSTTVAMVIAAVSSLRRKQSE